MSAPLSGSGGSPAPGFYPDPSIPGYIRYWNGTSWVPGTSRPEPRDGDPMPAPPPSAAAGPAVTEPEPSPAMRQEAPPAEETGPVFLDEEPVAGPAVGLDTGQVGSPADGFPSSRGGEALPELRPRGEIQQTGTTDQAGTIDWDDPGRLHGQRPEPASAWQADASRQAGFAGQSEERVSWGRGEGAGEPAGSPATGPTADPRGGWGRSADESPTDPSTDAPAAGSDAAVAASSAVPQQPSSEGTFQMRAMSAEDLRNAAREARGGASQVPEHTVGLRRSDVLRSATSGAEGTPGGGAQAAGPAASAVPGQGVPPAQPQSHAAWTPPAQQAPSQTPPAAHAPPEQRAAPSQVPSEQGGFGQGAPAQPSWAQQVQDLAGGRGQAGGPGGHEAFAQGGGHGQQGGGQEAVTPWRPPTSDPFLAAAAQHEARPAGLGKRFGARLVDGVLTSAVAVGVAFPFAGQAVDHVQQKIDAVRQAGETKQVWLIDATTGGYLAVVLGALLLFGLVYEVLPTRRWGRTLGKKMFGLRVLTMEQHESPGFGSALLRWLTYSGLAVLVVGVVNVLWCVFDRPWRQCWHDKIAGTFVSKDSGEIRL